VILILEVIGPQAARLGGASRQEFGAEGGSIGRENGSTWVLPHTKVSGLHALISHRSSVFYIEDRSRNGVCLNSAGNRLVRGQPYPLKSGDSIFIDPYEIRVSMKAESSAAERRAGAEPGRYSLQERDHFDADPFASRRPPLPSSSDLEIPFDPTSGAELDPLKLLDPIAKPGPVRKAPSARDLARSSPLEEHYRPPPVLPAPASAPWDPTAIPQDYDPLEPDDPPLEPDASLEMPAPLPPRLPTPAAPVPQVQPPEARPVISSSPPRQEPPALVANPPTDAVDDVARTPAPQRVGHDSELAAMLAGAGLDGVAVTPELARSFGEILRVVVSGVMDVLRARQQIKDEFRMRMTQFRPADNNPLKFSANVDDALHNLLVKRNAAYLGPVEAFEDAFDDLRNHQIAMLAGMRVAFESMLTQFDPDHLQEQFDRQLKKGSLLGVPARLRYWDSYRDACSAMVKDPEACFRKLFGEEFAKAYEEQLKRLKAEGIPGKTPPKAPGQP